MTRTSSARHPLLKRFEAFDDVRQLSTKVFDRGVSVGGRVVSWRRPSLEEGSEVAARQFEGSGHGLERPARALALDEVVLELADGLQRDSGPAGDVLLRQIQLVHSGVNRPGYGVPVVRHRHPS